MDKNAGILLDYQNKWIADKSEVRVYEKSRRIGISWATACEAVLEASAAKGMDVWYVGYNKDMALEFINDVAFWSKKLSIIASAVNESVLEDENKDILTYSVKFSSGFRVTALSSKPNNLRGKQGYVVIDEAAFHDKLGELVKSAMALLIWGGKVAIISTHNGVDNAFNQLCVDIKACKVPYSLHKTTFADAIEQGLYKRICRVTNRDWSQENQKKWTSKNYDFYGDDATEELDVIPSNSGGAVLSRALLEMRSQVVPVLRLTKSDSFSEYPEYLRRAELLDWCKDELLHILEGLEDSTYCFGVDFARSSDLSVIALLEITQTVKRVCPFVVEMQNIPHAQQKQILFYILERIPRLQAGMLDATGNGEYLAETTKDKFGSKITPVKLSNKWYSENMPKFIAAFEDDNITIAKDKDIIDDHRALQRVDGIIKLPKGKTDKKSKRHGDSAIAFALAYISSFSEVVIYDYEAVTNNKKSGFKSGFKRGAL